MKSKVIATIKQKQKDLVESIRDHKRNFKYKDRSLCWEFRHRHIAYCLLRGKTLEQIETQPTRWNKAYNAPDAKLYTKYLEAFTKALKEEAEANNVA